MPPRAGSPNGRIRAIGLRSSQSLTEPDPGFFGVVLAAYIAVTISRIHEVIPVLTRLYLGKVSAAALLVAAFTIPGSEFQRVFKTPVAKYVVILTVIAIASVPGSAWPRQSFSFFQDWWPQVMLMFVCVCAGFANKRTADLCLVTLTLSAGFAALMTMATGHVDSGGRAFIGNHYAATYDANMSAALFVCALPYAAMLAIRTGWTRWAGIAVIPVLIAATVRILEVLVVISIGAARWILLQAIDDRLTNGRLICRQVRGKVGICHVEEHEIYQIDPGGYGWCVYFIGYVVTLGSFHGLRNERTHPEENRDGQR